MYNQRNPSEIMTTPNKARKPLIALPLITLILITSILANEKSESHKPPPTSDHFYYINIFQGHFPIPTRYGVAIPDHNENEPIILELNSQKINFNNLSSEEKIKSIKSGSGYIRAGHYSTSLSEGDLTKGLILIKDKEVYGLTVKSFTYKTKENSKNIGISSVIISDKKSFLLISDEDTNLWGRLLTQYGKINNIEK